MKPLGKLYANRSRSRVMDLKERLTLTRRGSKPNLWQNTCN
jgi:hypothetical protein